ncbi:hypothetical protein CDO73_26290 [Saccharibacillus sp. O23]|uniref:hypothetical protein n=1 Tax=Saccharibacillus sp. O23 TaxID=2009338 RepID=UPI000B41A92B|nr:hypothetical protein [Saccharibacillus sp. O23]OWA33015.1 hypothetical protein B9G55_23750 [Saccharibacillus sp. O16]OWR25689.1 hypothetical protein CDO73_26290 [Saccharibacillus sp. O23]
MYNTIGTCEDCGREQRFLNHVDFSECGIEVIALCAYGCEDMRSIAQPPETMVQAALETEIERLKQEERKAKAAPNQTVSAEALTEIKQRIALCEYTGKQNESGRMDEGDWVRIVELSKRMESETRRAIEQYEAMPQNVQALKAWMQLGQQERFYKELCRYAAGQCM